MQAPYTYQYSARKIKHLCLAAILFDEGTTITHDFAKTHDKTDKMIAPETPTSSRKELRMSRPSASDGQVSPELEVPAAVKKLHTALFRRANDTHIFAQQALQLLRREQERYESSKKVGLKPYTVPARKGTALASRTDRDLRDVYDRYIEKELYNNFLVALVSQCESFIFDTLRIVLRARPKKLTINCQGVDTKRTIDIDIVLNAQDIDAARNAIIEQRLHSLSYAKPADYLRCLQTIAQIDISDDAFQEYLEVKAARDVIIHNAGIINATYLAKAGDRARGDEGDELVMNTEYFEHCIRVIKQ